jgi:hypothetical protein
LAARNVRRAATFSSQEDKMAKSTDQKGQPEAVATFAASARNKGRKPPDQGLEATPETAGKPGDLSSEERDAADILGGNATGDKARADAARNHHAKTDKRAG